MKKFFSVRQFTAFDFLSLYYICAAATEDKWYWLLLLFPQIIVSVILENYFIQKEDENESGR